MTLFYHLLRRCRFNAAYRSRHDDRSACAWSGEWARTSGDPLVSEVLEPRCMLSANIHLDSSTGIVTISGSGLADQAVVSSVDGGHFRVDLSNDSGSESESFSYSQVTKISFLGYGGDDYFDNQVAIRSYAAGHAGNDQLHGGLLNNHFYGGAGDDQLFGGPRNDGLFGGDGNDRIFGMEGHDLLIGQNGDDFIQGLAGDDRIYGSAGDDELYGDNGDDLMSGGLGDDFISGGNDRDSIFGDEGNDTIQGDNQSDYLHGGNGNDIINGGQGNDLIFGDAGDDQLNGDADNDTIWGFDGNDVIHGGTWNDTIYGQDGNDSLFGDDGVDVILGQAGSDKIFGGDGPDTLYGGDGPDYISGESGNDKIFGDNGNDTLFGDSGSDEIHGGNGDDVLFGGQQSAIDTLYSNGGRDRYLIEGADVMADRSTADAALKFDTGDRVWTSKEIEVINQAFDTLFSETDNNRLLRGSLDSDHIIVYKKYAQLAGGAVSINREHSVIVNGVTTIYREIDVSDWDENNSELNALYVEAMLHENGHSWDSTQEIAAAVPALSGLWNTFLSRSGWRNTVPSNQSLYNVSGDGKWWYLKTAEFAHTTGEPTRTKTGQPSGNTISASSSLGNRPPARCSTPSWATSKHCLRRCVRSHNAGSLESGLTISNSCRSRKRRAQVIVHPEFRAAISLER